MTIKSAVAALVLGAGLVAGPAFAQSMTLGGEVIAEGDVAAVQARCDELKKADDTSSTSSSESSDTAATDPNAANSNNSDGTDTSVSNENVASGIDQALTSIDLNTVTLGDCEAGGWFAAQ